MSRFDYVKYDDTAVLLQNHFKAMCEQLEASINSIGNRPMAYVDPVKVGALGRSKAMAFTKLEELYMWIGKAVRDDQIIRNGSAELQEERKNG